MKKKYRIYYDDRLLYGRIEEEWEEAEFCVEFSEIEEKILQLWKTYEAVAQEILKRKYDKIMY